MKVVDFEVLYNLFDISYLRELASFGALSDDTIYFLLKNGTVRTYEEGEVVATYGKKVDGFSIILEGDVAFYKHCEDHDVLTRHFVQGDQMCFDLMIGLIKHNGTEIAQEKSTILYVGEKLFHDLHIKFPDQFGLFMINMSRELAREIALLEDVIGDSTGWEQRKNR